jgi:hypothetical protein
MITLHALKLFFWHFPFSSHFRSSNDSEAPRLLIKRQTFCRPNDFRPKDMEPTTNFIRQKSLKSRLFKLFRMFFTLDVNQRQGIELVPFPGTNLVKNFKSNLLTFCELDHLSRRNKVFKVMKRSSLPKV